MEAKIASELGGVWQVNNGGSYSIRNPIDEGVRALLASAKKSILVAQQDFFAMVGKQLKTIAPCLTDRAGLVDLIDLRLVNVLADKILEGVQVRIVLSQPYGESNIGESIIGGYSNMESMGMFGDVLAERVRARSARFSATATLMTDVEARTMLCERLEYAGLRITENWDHWPKTGNLNRLHSKVYLVDEAAYLIGSRNAYPSNLQQFGYIVQDPVSAAEFKTQFFDPMWKYSKLKAYSGGSQKCGFLSAK